MFRQRCQKDDKEERKIENYIDEKNEKFSLAINSQLSEVS
jgi:hypothetical protein